MGGSVSWICFCVPLQGKALTISFCGGTEFSFNLGKRESNQNWKIKEALTFDVSKMKGL